MAGKVGKLTQKQRDACLALAGGATAEIAAAIAHVRTRTIFKWKAENPLFQQELRDLENQALQTVASDLVYAAHNAVRILDDIQSDTNVKPHVRVAAANGILSAVLRYAETVKLEARIAALEARIEA